MRIGIAISGGGYRATSYSLGVFSYLNHIKIDDKPALQHVEALSTVSGGSITGITYAQSVKEGESFEAYFQRMFTFITTYDLVADSVHNYVSNSSKANSLIEGFAQTYAQKLLKGKTFESIIPKGIEVVDGKIVRYDSHLKFNCINATDFNTGSPFRFIAVSGDCDYKPKFGNGFYSLNKKAIKNIRLEIPLAASSCFPGGFEPIVLPLDNELMDISTVLDDLGKLEDEYKKMDQEVIPKDDLEKLYEKEQLALHIKQTKQIINNKKCIALMDGGIMDNQGIEALIDYEKSKENLDLLMVIDVSSPNFDKYIAADECKVPLVGHVKMIELLYLTFFITILSISVASYAYINDFTNLLIISTVFSTIFSICSVGLIFGKIAFKNIINASRLDFGRLKVLNELTPNAVLQLVKNRFTSVGLLVQSVFMKQLRRKNIEEMYQTYTLTNKRIVNHIYSLKSTNKLHDHLKFNKIKIPEDFKQPTYLMRQICDRAYAMGTTLWVDKSNEGHDLVVDVIVAGQMTTCANILVYYASFEKDIKNAEKAIIEDETGKKVDIDKNIQIIRNNEKPLKLGRELYEQAKVDWDKFVENPYWLVESYNVKLSGTKKN